MGVLGHQSSSTLDSVGQDELQEKGNKGGRVKGTAKSSANLHSETDQESRRGLSPADTILNWRDRSQPKTLTWRDRTQPKQCIRGTHGY